MRPLASITYLLALTKRSGNIEQFVCYLDIDDSVSDDVDAISDGGVKKPLSWHGSGGTSRDPDAPSVTLSGRGFPNALPLAAEAGRVVSLLLLCNKPDVAAEECLEGMDL